MSLWKKKSIPRGAGFCLFRMVSTVSFWEQLNWIQIFYHRSLLVCQIKDKHTVIHTPGSPKYTQVRNNDMNATINWQQNASNELVPHKKEMQFESWNINTHSRHHKACSVGEEKKRHKLTNKRELSSLNIRFTTHQIWNSRNTYKMNKRHWNTPICRL